jgi:hypothetical protein
MCGLLRGGLDAWVSGKWEVSRAGKNRGGQLREIARMAREVQVEPCRVVSCLVVSYKGLGMGTGVRGIVELEE